MYMEFDTLPSFLIIDSWLHFEVPLFLKSRGALGQLFEVAGPSSAAQH